MQILNAIYVIAYRKKMKKTKKEGSALRILLDIFTPTRLLKVVLKRYHSKRD